MVPGPQIQLGEDGEAMQFVQELIDDGNGILVLDGALVEGLIVDAEAPRSIRLLDQQYQR